MNEYELTLTVKNAVLLNVMRSRGIKTAAQLSRASGAGQAAIGQYLNLSSTPFTRTGDLKVSAELLTVFFGLDVEFLFPVDELYLSLEKNKFTAQVNKSEMLSLSNSCPSALLEVEEEESESPFNGMLDGTRLGDREKIIIKRRIEDAATLQTIGDELNISKDRVRQILENALRKLKSDVSLGVDLVGIAGVYAGEFSRDVIPKDEVLGND